MTSVTIREAQANLRELIHGLMTGGEVVITENDNPVAKRVAGPPKSKSPLRPPPGLGKEYIAVINNDNEHLKDFEEIRQTSGLCRLRCVPQR